MRGYSSLQGGFRAHTAELGRADHDTVPYPNPLPHSFTQRPRKFKLKANTHG